MSLVNFKPERITVHCAGTANGKKLTIHNVRKWHIDERGWDDVGYHYFIRLNGMIETGRDLGTQGAHVRGDNKNNVGICLAGTDCYTKEQLHSLRALINQLRETYRIPIWNVFAHNEFTKKKTCPGFSAKLLVCFLLMSRGYEPMRDHLIPS